MAAEAVHISALTDARPKLNRALRAFLEQPGHWQAARLGSVIVDFPYFYNFPGAALRYAFKLNQQASPWGEINHSRAPINVGVSLIGAARQLHNGGDGHRARLLRALALGYFSHMAVDIATHPFVNAEAAERTRELGKNDDHHHREIEKFQSIIFHEQRNGFDFMGERHLKDYIRVESELLTGDPSLFASYQAGLARAVGRVLERREFLNWARGYRQYAWLISGPVGKTIAPEREKQREKPRLYDPEGFNYPALYSHAVDKVCAFLESVWAHIHGAPFDHDLIPEGCIDKPPMPEQDPRKN